MMYGGQILEQALLLYPLVLGIYISFTVLKIADLTVDGSFLLGAAVFATLGTKGVPLMVALFAAMLAGAAAGGIAAIAQYKSRIDPLITGILMAFILHSLSLVVMARPNIGLLQTTTIFTVIDGVMMSPLFVRVAMLVAIMMSLVVLLSVILSSRYGLWLKAFGNNANLVALLGKSPERLRVVGLAIGNALAALSGCLTAQASGYTDINMGFGQALIGISIILLSKELVRLLSSADMVSDAVSLGAVMLSCIIYFVLTNELIRWGLNPVYLKMAIGVSLIAFLLFTSRQKLMREFVS